MSIVDVNSEYLGVNRTLLMENAGRGLADFILETGKSTSCSNVVILAGKGGNGGDGMVAARHLVRNIKVSLSLLGSSNEIKKRSTLLNWNILKEMSQSIELNEINKSDDLEKYVISSQTIVVDAIFGTGIKGEIRGMYKDAIEVINSWRKKGATIVCVDTPSGINPDSGIPSDIHVKPHYTCVFHRNKSGLNYKWEAFVWTKSDGMKGLGFLPGEIESNASAISGDGSTIVGTTYISSSSSKAFRWNKNIGMTALETNDPEILDLAATDVSEDGAIIVGQAFHSKRAWDASFVWNKNTGAENLRGILEGYGIDLTGWTLSSAKGISNDGATIVGWGRNPSGQQEAWVAILPTQTPTNLPPINTTIEPISVERGQWQRYKQTLNDGYTSLTISIVGGLGDADLYIRKDISPTTWRWSCRPYQNGNNETCTIAGTWHIGLKGYRAASNVSLKIVAIP